jgi:sulfonate transport system ATP-binding protein
MTPKPAPPVVRVRNLARRFTLKGVLNGVDLDIRKGEFVALLGRSGCGKSTLLRALAGLDHEATGSGDIVVPRKLSVVFQDARLLPWKPVLDNVILGLTGPDAKARGRQALAEVELAGREGSWPYELSGGEQQRVALARSLVRAPELLLADEPFGALDALTRIRMHLLLKDLSERHRPAVLLVTHDVDEAIELADRVVVLEAGKVAADISVDLPKAGPERSVRFAQLRRQLLGRLGVVDSLAGRDPAPVPFAANA